MSELAACRLRRHCVGLVTKAIDPEAFWDGDVREAVATFGRGALEEWVQVEPSGRHWDDLINEVIDICALESGASEGESGLERTLVEMAECSHECAIWYAKLAGPPEVVYDEKEFARKVVEKVRRGDIEPALRFVRT